MTRAAGAVFFFALAAGVTFAASAPVVFQSGPGRFEVAATDAVEAKTVTAAADECWRTLAEPLGLPEAFPSPVFARVVPAADWNDPAAFRVLVEPGGVVSLRVRATEIADDTVLRRALVQALLLRLAVARHGVNPRLTAPLWLEMGCVGWWRTRSDPAQLDALKQASASFAAPALVDLLGWQRGGAEPAEWKAGAVSLLTFFQTEATKAGEWRALLGRLLAGDEPVAALAATYPGRFQNAGERELWWATGWHHLRRARTLPTLDAAESRRELEALSRFVFVVDGKETAPDLAAVLAHRRDPAVQTELARRAAALNRVVGALHPFYRNAGLSLADAFAKSGAGRAAAFARDWQDATELEAATTAALDALERRAR